MQPSPIFVLALVVTTIAGQAQTYDLLRHFNVALGTVNTMAQMGDTLFIGGDFSHVAQARSFGTVVSTTDGSPDRDADRPEAKVVCTVPDGAGGWFVGGFFTLYNDQPRNGLAHTDGEGHLTGWVPEVDPETVGWAVTLDNGWVFTGGNEVITAVDAVTGENIGWSVPLNGGIAALAVDDGILYVGGNFNMVGTEMRSNLAAIDIASGSVTPWNVSCNARVRCLLATPDALLVGGDFSTVAGSNRKGVCALDYGTALCTTWDASTNLGGQVHALATSGTLVNIGGQFTTVNGAARLSLASVDGTTGTVLDWDAPVEGVSGIVRALCVSDGLVFVGGEYSSLGGEERWNIGAVDAAAGLVDPWVTPTPDGPVISLAPNGGGRLFIGGDFTTAGSVPRVGLAAISLSTGEVLPWRYDVTGGPVNAICLGAGKLFIGGQFSSIAGQYRPNLGAVDMVTGQVLDWAPTPNNYVNAVAVHGSRLYAGGYFDVTATLPRSRVASFELPSLDITGWNPLLMGLTQVHAFGFHENLAYVGKDPGLVVVDTASSLFLPFAPEIEWGAVRCFAEREGTMYFGGAFVEVNGQDRDYAAAEDAATGELKPWDINAQSGGNEINAIATNATSVFVGGVLICIGGTFDGGLLPVDPTTGAAQINTDVFSQYGVRALVASNSAVYAGGANYTVFHNPRRGLAGYGIHGPTTGLQRSGSAVIEGGLELWPSPYTDGALHMGWTSATGEVPISVGLFDAGGRHLGALRWMKAGTDGLMRGDLHGIADLRPASGFHFIRAIFKDETRVAYLVVE